MRTRKGGWNSGWLSAVDCEGRTVWIADAHRDGKRFVVHAVEKLTAFVELESAFGAAKDAKIKKQLLRLLISDLSFFRRNLAFLADHNFSYPFDPQNPR